MNPEIEQEVRLAQLGEPDAVERLCARWLPTVLGWTRRLGGSKVHAEDAAHEVLIVALRRLSSLERVSAFKSWLYGITRRVVAAQRRRAWVRRWLPGVEPTVVDDGPTPLRLAERHAIAGAVWEALDKLPSHHREILVLCDLEERADSEAAELLGIPKGTVKSRLRRARLSLRKHLARFAVETIDGLDDREAP